MRSFSAQEARSEPRWKRRAVSSRVLLATIFWQLSRAAATVGRLYLSITSNVFPAGASQEAAMDPTLAPGTRKLFTDLDVAALDDIGWDAAQVPEPSSIVMIFSAAIVFCVGAVRRRRKQKS